MTDIPADPTAPATARSAGRQLLAKHRDDRRKAALKANMARRKAQVRGRAQDSMAEQTGINPDTQTDNDTRNG